MVPVPVTSRVFATTFKVVAAEITACQNQVIALTSQTLRNCSLGKRVAEIQPVRLGSLVSAFAVKDVRALLITAQWVLPVKPLTSNPVLSPTVRHPSVKVRIAMVSRPVPPVPAYKAMEAITLFAIRNAPETRVPATMHNPAWLTPSADKL